MKRWDVDYAEKRGVKHVNLLFTSLTSKIHSVQIPIEEFEEASKYGIGFDGSSVGLVDIENSDLMLRPDPKTFRIASFEDPPIGLAIAEIYEGDRLSPLDPRGILKRAVKNMREKLGKNIEYLTSPEIEFWLFKVDDGNIKFQDNGSYFSFPPEDLGYKIRLEIASALEDIGIIPEKIHHEVPPGKHEIDFRYSKAVETADNTIFYKYTVRTIALKHDLIASFMPKPFYGEYGAGMHTHLSLYDNESKVNLFYGDKKGLSEIALFFIGGLLKHANSIAAVTNPSVNSYKRLVPGWEAPVYITWARLNRSALIRVPMSTKPEKTRIEYRATDSSCNPYLAFTVILSAGIDGILNKIAPPEPVEEDIYKMTTQERERRGIKTLPGSLGEALKEMERDGLVEKSLGRRAFKRFIELKKIEWFEYNVHVHEWERRKYLYL